MKHVNDFIKHMVSVLSERNFSFNFEIVFNFFQITCQGGAKIT